MLSWMFEADSGGVILSTPEVHPLNDLMPWAFTVLFLLPIPICIVGMVGKTKTAVTILAFTLVLIIGFIILYSKMTGDIDAWSQNSVETLNERYPEANLTLEDIEAVNLYEHMLEGHSSGRYVFWQGEAIRNPDTGEWVEESKSLLIDGNVVELLVENRVLVNEVK